MEVRAIFDEVIPRGCFVDVAIGHPIRPWREKRDRAEAERERCEGRDPVDAAVHGRLPRA
jgi:hypothetical protein